MITGINLDYSLRYLFTLPIQSAHFLYNFQVKLVSSHSASTEAELNLYRRYQIGIHKDPPEKITRKSFENFLIRSPLQVHYHYIFLHFTNLLFLFCSVLFCFVLFLVFSFSPSILYLVRLIVCGAFQKFPSSKFTTH